MRDVNTTVAQGLQFTASLPGSPDSISPAVRLLQTGRAQFGRGCCCWSGARSTARSLGVVEVLELLARSSSGGMKSEEVDRLPPAVRVAFIIVPLRDLLLLLLLPLLFEKANSHFQDVGLLQFGAGVVAMELLLQETFELVDAAVDAVPAHLFHNRLSQLKEIGTLNILQTAHRLKFTLTCFGRRTGFKRIIPLFSPYH